MFIPFHFDNLLTIILCFLIKSDAVIPLAFVTMDLATRIGRNNKSSTRDSQHTYYMKA